MAPGRGAVEDPCARTSSRQEKENIEYIKGEVKLSLFADDVIV